MITKEKYIEYLICTPVNYTCTNLSDHAENTSHDSVSDFERETHNAMLTGPKVTRTILTALKHQPK